MEVNLPTEGVTENIDNFFIIYNNNTIFGSIGIEIYGDAGLMRSVAIHPSLQGHGYGMNLVNTLENYAKKKGLKKLYLLTDTAEEFFKKLNYKVIPREKANPKIKESLEFLTLCSSSPLLEKDL